MSSFQKCPQCDAIVSAKNFTSHLINKHSDSKRPLSFVCPYPPCTRAFAYSKLLLDHIRKKHSGIGSNSDGPSTETPDPPPSGELSIDIPNPSSDDNPTTEDDVIDLNLDQDISDQNLEEDSCKPCLCFYIIFYKKFQSTKMSIPLDHRPSRMVMKKTSPI